jgi:hypothetical protein
MVYHIYHFDKLHQPNHEILWQMDPQIWEAGLILHQGYVPENVTQTQHKIPI